MYPVTNLKTITLKNKYSKNETFYYFQKDKFNIINILSVFGLSYNKDNTYINHLIIDSKGVTFIKKHLRKWIKHKIPTHYLVSCNNLHISNNNGDFTIEQEVKDSILNQTVSLFSCKSVLALTKYLNIKE